MIDFYDEETGQTWKVCPNCMHKELIGEEDGN